MLDAGFDLHGATKFSDKEQAQAGSCSQGAS